MRYQHFYRTSLNKPPKLVRTEAWLTNKDNLTVATAFARVRKGDTPLKKLGRIMAHNRCVKAFVE